MRDLPFHLQALHAAYAAGALATDVIAECHRRIVAAGDPGIFIHVMDEDWTLEQARRLPPFDPASYPLWGLPFAIKDNIDLAGAPTTAACPDIAALPEVDAFVVARLRQAGAIPVGKTNLDQFATGLVGVRTPYPVPRNALDPAIVPGGSSSGSGVAVALGLVSFALGTDTAGSGRVPAALNNVVGLKPTLGTLSATGCLPACRTVDTISIFAGTVSDAHAVFTVAAAPDPADAYSRSFPTSALQERLPRPRIGIPDENSLRFFGDTIQAAAHAAALDRVETMGADLVEIDFTPFYAIADMLYEDVWVAERHTVLESLLETRPEVVHPVVAGIVGKAKGFTATDTFRSFYRMEDLRRDARTAMAGLDMLCVPSIPTFYSRADLEADPLGPNRNLGAYTNFVNLLDLCGIAVPMAPRADGRPGSVTLLARAGEDGAIAALAARLHADAGAAIGATDWPVPGWEPPLPSAGPGEIALAAVGAHMSGLPLNGELTRLGARFLRRTRTSADYRLYRLEGGPPARPGLARMVDGARIDLEIWALPEDRVGAFLRGVPAPLGIGAVTLEDGETVKGFICEPAGLIGARDITEFGGWRAFLAAEASSPPSQPTTRVEGEQHAQA